MSLKESCIILDLVMAAIFFLIGFLFYRSNGKAANSLTGYNMKSAEERKKYDEKKMCKDYGKRMMLWPIPFFIGAVIDSYKGNIDRMGHMVRHVYPFTDRKT